MTCFNSINCALLLLIWALAAANAVSISRTNKDADNMPAVPVLEGQKAKSGFYEPLGQAPIAVAHGLQLPCGNNFLMMVRMKRKGNDVPGAKVDAVSFGS